MCSSVVPPGPQVLTNTPLESAAQSKEGHVSQRMLEHYSHVRMDAKRKALDALSRGADGTKRVTNGLKGCCQVLKLLKTLAGTTGFEPATSCVTGLGLPLTHCSISFPHIGLHPFRESAFARS